VEPDGGLLNITGGGIDVFGVRRLPAEFTVAFALQLIFDQQEAGNEVELATVVRGPDLEPLGERAAWRITPELGKLHAPGWRGCYTIAGAITLAVKAEGPHSVAVQIAGAEAGDIPFQVLLTDA